MPALASRRKKTKPKRTLKQRVVGTTVVGRVVRGGLAAGVAGAGVVGGLKVYKNRGAVMGGMRAAPDAFSKAKSAYQGARHRQGGSKSKRESLKIAREIFNRNIRRGARQGARSAAYSRRDQVVRFERGEIMPVTMADMALFMYGQAEFAKKRPKPKGGINSAIAQGAKRGAKRGLIVGGIGGAALGGLALANPAVRNSIPKGLRGNLPLATAGIHGLKTAAAAGVLGGAVGGVSYLRNRKKNKKQKR